MNSIPIGNRPGWRQLMLLSALALLTSGLGAGTASAAGGNRFKASGPNMGAGEGISMPMPPRATRWWVFRRS